MSEKRQAADAAVQRVDAYACGQCGGLHRTEEVARACCACATCGVPFAKNKSFRTECGHCRYGSSLRAARANVRRYEQSIASAKANLERLLADKRPPKGSP